ncbi:MULTISPECIES: HAD hydrolase-like protein [Henriciella]|uniref:HAD hydrolase-like protein n=1 Tax=Henriciella TaxID=453849 RepID=UPI0035148FC5
METRDLQGWTIVFDLDGTLVDSAPDLHAALNHCLMRAGFRPVPFELISGMIGEGAKAMIQKGLGYQEADDADAVVESLWDDFLDHYRRNICNLSELYPGADAALAQLADAGAICAVCTNKTQALSEAVLLGLGISHRFASIVGADAVPSKKPDGDHIIQAVLRAGGTTNCAIMIGDSQTDEKAARNAGLPFVFVPFGYGPSPTDLSEVSGICETYSELPGLIRAIIA